MRKGFAIGVALFLVLLLGLSGCNLFKEPEQPIEAPTDPLSELILGNTTFAFNLYQSLKAARENIIFSPYSISLAMAMAYAGAKGETEKQMQEVMHFTLPQEELHATFHQLNYKLVTRGQGSGSGESSPSKLNIASSFWGQVGHPFLQEFLDTLEENYGGVKFVDFAKAPENSRRLINEWVSEQTNGKIQDFLPPGSITPPIRVVLTTALYFSAKWIYQFYPQITSDKEFYLLDNRTVLVPMMHQCKVFRYAEDSDCQVIELPYGRPYDPQKPEERPSPEFSMVIILPKPGLFEKVEASLNGGRINELLKSLQDKKVSLTMPKFSYECKYSLNEYLAALGMSDPFLQSKADFSGMDGARDIWLDDVRHKAFISVDEYGTEAAATTLILIAGAPPVNEEIKIMNINRPFVFFIRDFDTGTILFMGRVLDPTKSS
jgi:serpin B